MRLIKSQSWPPVFCQTRRHSHQFERSFPFKISTHAIFLGSRHLDGIILAKYNYSTTKYFTWISNRCERAEKEMATISLKRYASTAEMQFGPSSFVCGEVFATTNCMCIESSSDKFLLVSVTYKTLCYFTSISCSHQVSLNYTSHGKSWSDRWTRTYARNLFLLHVPIYSRCYFSSI
jgi:hypothetical protein